MKKKQNKVIELANGSKINLSPTKRSERFMAESSLIYYKDYDEDGQEVYGIANAQKP